jgi:septal ring factor EnvC (AmiA/AmiB activator)
VPVSQGTRKPRPGFGFRAALPDAGARRRDREATARALRDARHAARQAATALAASQRALALAKTERARLQDQLQFALKKIDDAAAEVRTCEARVAEAGHAQSHLEAKLAALAARNE